MAEMKVRFNYCINNDVESSFSITFFLFNWEMKEA